MADDRLPLRRLDDDCVARGTPRVATRRERPQASSSGTLVIGTVWRFSTVVGFALSMVTHAVMAQGGDVAKIDRYVARELARQHIPGMAVGIYRNGTIAPVKGYGLANEELSVAVKPATIFQSGSIGKQFTATAIMMLVEDGKVALDDSLPKYFPEAPATWRGITVRKLLNHTSGLSDYTSDSLTRPGGPINLRADYTEAQLVSIIETLPNEFAPGDRWEYCNTNYVLLGAIIRGSVESSMEMSCRRASSSRWG